MFKLSPHCRIVPCGDVSVVYHSLFGNPLVVDNQALRLLESYKQPKPALPYSDSKIDNEAIKQILPFIVEQGMQERDKLILPWRRYEADLASGKCITYLSLIMAECCNFRCSYCMARALRDKRKSNSLMKPEVAFKAIDLFASLIRKHRHQEAYLNFGGGEPLLNISVIRTAVEYCRQSYPDINFRFNINTNASLVTKEIATFFKEYDFQVASSLDGFKKWNNKVRVYSDGSGTFDYILQGFNNMRSVGIDLNGFSVTITQDNYPGITEELIEWAAQQGYVDIRLDFDVVHWSDIDVSEVVRRLMRLKRFGKTRGVYVSGFWERPAENMYPSILDNQTGFCGGQKGHSMCVAPSGDIYICGYSGTKVGSVNIPEEYIPNEKYVEVIASRFVGRNKQCLGCDIEGQCIGGCFISAEYANESTHSAIDFNCQLYKAMTIELLREQAAEQ